MYSVHICLLILHWWWWWRRRHHQSSRRQTYPGSERWMHVYTGARARARAHSAHAHWSTLQRIYRFVLFYASVILCCVRALFSSTDFHSCCQNADRLKESQMISGRHRRSTGAQLFRKMQWLFFFFSSRKLLFDLVAARICVCTAASAAAVRCALNEIRVSALLWCVMPLILRFAATAKLTSYDVRE